MTQRKAALTKSKKWNCSLILKYRLWNDYIRWNKFKPVPSPGNCLISKLGLAILKSKFKYLLIDCLILEPNS